MLSQESLKELKGRVKESFSSFKDTSLKSLERLKLPQVHENSKKVLAGILAAATILRRKNSEQTTTVKPENDDLTPPPPQNEPNRLKIGLTSVFLKGPLYVAAGQFFLARATNQSTPFIITFLGIGILSIVNQVLLDGGIKKEFTNDYKKVVGKNEFLQSSKRTFYAIGKTPQMALFLSSLVNFGAFCAKAIPPYTDAKQLLFSVAYLVFGQGEKALASQLAKKSYGKDPLHNFTREYLRPKLLRGGISKLPKSFIRFHKQIGFIPTQAPLFFNIGHALLNLNILPSLISLPHFLESCTTVHGIAGIVCYAFLALSTHEIFKSMIPQKNKKEPVQLKLNPEHVKTITESESPSNSIYGPLVYSALANMAAAISLFSLGGSVDAALMQTFFGISNMFNAGTTANLINRIIGETKEKEKSLEV